MNADFEKMFNPLEETELPQEKLEDENNGQYFMGTEKYNSNNIPHPYISFYKDKNNFILGRIFLDKNKKEKYIEIFKNRIMNFLEISPNITFIYPYSNDVKDHYEQSKMIGFRYYENDTCQEGNYFTLIKKNYSDYFILEKDETIIDINGNKFYDEQLDCLQIIKKIIIKKNKNKIIGANGETFPEIIAYCFVLASIGKIGNLVFLKPLIANLDSNCIIPESLPKDIDENNIYIEPFIYDGHISTILSSFRIYRFSIFLDMSHHHFDGKSPIFPFLSKSLKNASHEFLPKKEIQEYSSCFLWFFGEIEYLLKHKNYSFKEIYNNLKGDNLDFLVDLINLLSKEIEGNECLIKVIEKKDKFLDKADKVEFNRYPFFTGNKYYEIQKEIVFNKFLDIQNLVDDRFMYPYEKEILYGTQSYITSIYNFKNKLLLNLRYYNMNPENKDFEDERKLILQTIELINEAIAFFQREYDYAFYHYNMLFYCLFIRNLLDNIINPVAFQEEEKKAICNFNFNNFKVSIFSNLSQIKRKIETKLRLFSGETILNELNCHNEICYSLMNK